MSGRSKAQRAPSAATGHPSVWPLVAVPNSLVRSAAPNRGFGCRAQCRTGFPVRVART